MEQPENDSNLSTTTPEPVTPVASSSEESPQRSSAESQGVLTEEEQARAAEARAELEKKAEEARQRRQSRSGTRDSSTAAKAVKDAQAAKEAEQKPKRGRAKGKAQVDEGPEQEVEIEGFEEKDIIEFISITDEFLEAFKIPKLAQRQKERLARPLTRVINKRLNKKVKKYSDETQVGLIVLGLVLERVKLGKQNHDGVRDEGARKDDAPSKLVEIRTASSGN